MIANTNIIIDIETIPMPTADLERMMPPEILSPKMPDDLANRDEPDYAEKCPKYASVKDDAEREKKRHDWIEGKRSAFRSKLEFDRQTWQAQQIDIRARFVESAALHARTGLLKMVGIRRLARPSWSQQLADAEGKARATAVGEAIPAKTSVYLWEDDPKVVKVVRAFVESRGADFFPFMLERQMVLAMIGDLTSMMTESDKARLITFYGNTFDLPFAARRAAINGSGALFKFLRKHRRGRYLDGDKFVDLCDEWQLGDRGESSGGLKELARTLGFTGSTDGDGKTFYRWYAENPEEGVAYLLNDLDMTEFCAGRLGVIPIVDVA